MGCHSLLHAGFDKYIQTNVAGLVLAGSADFKTELGQSDLLDQRLQAKIIKVVDVSYGGENGFNQAIELSAESLSNVKFVQEKKLIQSYFNEISQDTGKFCFGVDDTLKALDLGAVETLIVWEGMDMKRFVLKDASGSEHVLNLEEEQSENRSFMADTSDRCPCEYRNGAGGRKAASGVVHRKVQGFRCQSRVCDRQVTRRRSIRQGLWWHWRSFEVSGNERREERRRDGDMGAGIN